MPAPQRHLDEDETVHGLAGTCHFMLPDSEVALGAGGTLFMPRGLAHGFVNRGTEIVRLLVVATPGRLGPTYFRAVADIINAGGPPADRLSEGRAESSRPARRGRNVAPPRSRFRALQPLPMKSCLFSLMALLLATTLAAADTTKPVHVALIFDDGPTPGQREKFLELFKAENIHVTFGTVAKNAEAHPELVRATLAAGHECANHSYSHPHPKALDDATLAHEIVGAQEIFTRILGTSPAWYWPPFLEQDPRMPALFAQAGLKVYTPKHLVGSADYDTSVTARQIYERSVAGVTDGTVILCHEWRPETLQQMPAIVAELKRQGCVFLTFSEMGRYLGQ